MSETDMDRRDSGSRYDDRPRSHTEETRDDRRDEPRQLRSEREQPAVSRVLGAFGLSWRTTERDLERVFDEFGRIEKVTLIKNNLGESRGFAFIYFEREDDATAARDKTNGMELQGRAIRVDYSLTNQPHERTPGQYMGPSRSNYSSRPRFDSRDRYDRYGGRDRRDDYDRRDRRDRYDRDERDFRGRRDYSPERDYRSRRNYNRSASRERGDRDRRDDYRRDDYRRRDRSRDREYRRDDRDQS